MCSGMHRGILDPGFLNYSCCRGNRMKKNILEYPYTHRYTGKYTTPHSAIPYVQHVQHTQHRTNLVTQDFLEAFHILICAFFCRPFGGSEFPGTLLIGLHSNKSISNLHIEFNLNIQSIQQINNISYFEHKRSISRYLRKKYDHLKTIKHKRTIILCQAIHPFLPFPTLTSTSSLIVAVSIGPENSNKTSNVSKIIQERTP